MGEISLADELRDNFMEEGHLPLVLKEGCIYKHFYHSDNLGETDDVLLLQDKAKPQGELREDFFFLLARQSILCYQK